MQLENYTVRCQGVYLCKPILSYYSKLQKIRTIITASNIDIQSGDGHRCERFHAFKTNEHAHCTQKKKNAF